MGKGTPSFGKHNKGPSHRRCRRCGNHSYLKNKRVCSSCGYGRTKKWRKYRWANKARAANGFPRRNIRAERQERTSRRQ